jgi:hypothetical protein
MIRVESLHAYIHWLPVTKIQFEAFLCDLPADQDAPDWYEEAIRLNPQVLPPEIGSANYWQAFLTGIRPDETHDYSSWSGPWDALPSKDEWFAAYLELRELGEIEVADLAEMSATPQIGELLLRVESASTRSRHGPRTLADQMLLKYGVMEWVRNDARGDPWAAFGRPDPRFHGNLNNLDTGRPSYPVARDGLRLASHGFRLLRSDEPSSPRPTRS